MNFLIKYIPSQSLKTYFNLNQTGPVPLSIKPYTEGLTSAHFYPFDTLPREKSVRVPPQVYVHCLFAQLPGTLALAKPRVFSMGRQIAEESVSLSSQVLGGGNLVGHLENNVEKKVSPLFQNMAQKEKASRILFVYPSSHDNKILEHLKAWVASIEAYPDGRKNGIFEEKIEAEKIKEEKLEKFNPSHTKQSSQKFPMLFALAQENNENNISLNNNLQTKNNSQKIGLQNNPPIFSTLSTSQKYRRIKNQFFFLGVRKCSANPISRWLSLRAIPFASSLAGFGRVFGYAGPLSAELKKAFLISTNFDKMTILLLDKLGYIRWHAVGSPTEEAVRILMKSVEEVANESEPVLEN